MKRRAFITLLGGAATAWPVAARAQQTMPVIGFLDPTSSENNAIFFRAFREGLKEAGYVEGENVAILYRSAENQTDRLPELAADLVRRRVSVITTFSNGALAAKSATSTIPIVFNIAEDPVKAGLVASLARPGGNMTGTNFLAAELTTKRLELLRDLVPAATRLAILINPTTRSAESTLRDAEAAVQAMGLKIQVVRAGSSREIDAVFEDLSRDRPDALFVGTDPFFTSRRVQLAILAARHAIPAAYAQRDIVDVGGLMSYGTSLRDAYRRVGAYTGRILKGEKPSDMPIVQASKFELVINVQTAKTLGLTVPSSLLARADEVVE